MIVVSDTSCISNLLTIGHAALLKDIFSEVIIPPAVERELRRFHQAIPSFVRLVVPQSSVGVEALVREVDRGEAEAICLARELRADRLLIDEKRGRAIAQREGIQVIGILGILLIAKNRDLIRSDATSIERLEKEAGFRLSTEVKRAAIAKAGENLK
jgi:predicted nucleic acid-binding protein